VRTDHDALVLRYFKNQNLRSVGLALGVSDDAAQTELKTWLAHVKQLKDEAGNQIHAREFPSFHSLPSRIG